MIFRLCFFLLLSSLAHRGIAQPAAAAPTFPPSRIIATDRSWEVSGKQTKFGEYPLSAEKIASAAALLSGGTHKAVVAAHSARAKVIPGALPIWRNQAAVGEWESYQFRKNVLLGAESIRKITLEVNSDDVARIYINKRLISAANRDGSIKDGYDDRYYFRSVSAFLDNRVYTYDVTDFFFTNFNNTILVEAVSLAFDGSHAYFSAKLVIEFGPKSESAPKPPAKSARRPIAALPPDRFLQDIVQAVRPNEPDNSSKMVGR
ncbi:MAG: hypothetical protein ACR2K1_09035 [Saprospiraceae bacterium]